MTLLLRLIAAASLATAGYIHADLYVHGYRVIPVVGPSFLWLAAASMAVALVIAAGAPPLVQFVSDPTSSDANKSFIPVTARDIGVANRVEPAYFQDATYAGTDYRVYTALVPDARNVLLVRAARPLSDQATILGWLAALLIVLTAA
ncbi:hypothetical protein ACFQ1S_30330, partial [Kibdelosporangium lantanae]